MSTFRNTLSHLHRCLWGWNRLFRNVGIQTSDIGELPRTKHTAFRTRRKFGIKESISCSQNIVLKIGHNTQGSEYQPVNIKLFIYLGQQQEPIEKFKWAVEFRWNVMAHCDAREGKRRGNWQMEWVASTFHTTSEHGVSSITTADAHTSAASRRLNWRPYWFKCSG